MLINFFSVIYGSERGFHAIDIESGSPYDLFIPTHQTPPIIPHAIVVLPESEGMELLLCYNDEGVYVNTYSEVTKDVMMQWGELPASVAYIRSGQVRPIYYTMADLLKHGKTNRYKLYI